MPATEVTSLILRFRDLVTPPGETLRRHRDLVELKGFVWWGWWNKFGERVPADLFRRLSAAEFELLLFDSGTNQVVCARCSGIVWGEDGAIASPNADATPEYYKT